MSAPCQVRMASIRRCLCGVRQWSKLSQTSRSVCTTFPNKLIAKISPAIVSKTHLYLSDIRKCEFSTAHEKSKCWNCGAELDKEKETFFCNCGVVQIIPVDTNFFELMGCRETFDIDTEAMSKLYKDLQRQYHPDKFSQKSKREQEIAESQSSFINKAYTTLLKPLPRGLYILELRGNPLEETNSSVDPGFLMEIMEFNEDLAEAEGDKGAMENLERINNKRIDHCVSEISKFFSEDNVTDAKACLIRLQYFTNIQDKIKEFYRKEM